MIPKNKKVVFMIPTDDMPPEKAPRFPSVDLEPHLASQKYKRQFPILLPLLFCLLLAWISIVLLTLTETSFSFRFRPYFTDRVWLKGDDNDTWKTTTRRPEMSTIRMSTSKPLTTEHPIRYIPRTTIDPLRYKFIKPWIYKTPRRYDLTKPKEKTHPVDLKFESPVNRTRLHDSPYHVITLIHYERNETYVMHLKKSGSVFVVDETLKYDEKVDCVYSGTIVSSHGGEYVGSASLSSCHHEIALEGMLSIRGVHYHLTPSPTLPTLHDFSNDDDKSNEEDRIRIERSNAKSKKKHVVPHVVSKAKAKTSDSDHGDPYRRHDNKIVPSDELRKAQEKMLKDQEPLEDEDDDENENEGGRDDDNDDSGLNAVEQNSFDSFDSNENNGELDEVAFAPKGKGKLKIQKSHKGEKAPSKKIELAIFTDPQFYKKWAEDYPKDTDTRINQFLLAMVNNMNYLYNQPSMKEKITFRLVQVKNMKSAPSGLKMTPYADKYLDTFCAWAGKQDTNGAVWDHAMMVTGYDLLDERGTDKNLGIAFTSTMCLQYYSCSLVEYVKGFETAYTATHEVGHSMGMLHDGEEFNRNCDEDKYMMAAISGKGQIAWSDCSNKNIQQFIATGDPKPGKTKSSYVPRCLNKKGSKRTSVQYQRGKFPGQIFDTKGQCKKACDGCVPHVTSAYPYNNICWMLHCTTPSNSIIDAHPALEGTVCATNKRCRAGRCM